MNVLSIKNKRVSKLLLVVFLVFTQLNIVHAEILSAISSGLNVRSGPSTKYRVVDTVSRGTIFEKIRTSGRWVKVRLLNGTKGWVSKRYTKRNNAEIKRGCALSRGAGVTVGSFVAGYGGHLARGVCCIGTIGFGCVACVAVISGAGAVTKYFVENSTEEVLCD